jgi:transposase InsO family protein
LECRVREICCRWTPSVSPGSPAPAIASPATAPARRRPPAWAGCSATRSSTITHAWPRPRSTPDETSPTVTAFTTTALAFFADHRITAERLQTDNAWEYVRNRSLAELLTDRGIQHRRIPPRTPKRNGKIERYQQTLAREWAHGQRYRDSDARAAALPIWLAYYNHTRNHSSLSNRPPITPVQNDPRPNT